MFIKVCGITRLTDALHATRHGATAVGFVFWPRSPRYIDPDRAAEIVAELPSSATPVGVFVNETPDTIRGVVARTGITVVQLHGDEPPAYAEAIAWPVMRSITLEDAVDVAAAWPEDTTFLLDATDPSSRGGTGRTVDWSRAAGIGAIRRLVLAGGLTPSNVAQAIGIVRPYGVDVSSGVEASPGVKDFDKVERFLAQAKAAFEQR